MRSAVFPVQFANPLLGMLNVIQFWFATFLFGGFLISADDTPWPVRAFTYISPIKYGTKAIMYSELHGTSWDGAVFDSSDPRGFSCPGDAGECYGATGDQVIRSMSKLAWKHLVDKNETAQDCLILFAIGIGFRFLYVVTAAIRCSSVQVVRESVSVASGSPRRKAYAGSPRFFEP